MADALWQDLRLAWRALRRAPAFSLAVVLTFSLGMAGATSMFALIEGILLRPLAVPDEDQLLVGWRQLPEPGDRRWSFTKAQIEAMHANSRRLGSVAAVGYNDPLPWAIAERDSVAFAQGARVTGAFFRVLGAGPALGRVLTQQDEVAGAENVLVISNGLWQRQYGGSRDVLGRRVTILNQAFTIVGVMPADVEYPRGVEAWTTVAAMQSTTSNQVIRDALQNELQMVARLRPDTTVAQAAEELRAIAPALEAQSAAGDAQDLVPAVAPLKESLVGDVRPVLAMLFGAVGLVLLVASANAAGLMLARGEARRGEFALRAALGSGRGRLMRQALFESTILALASGAVGLLVSRWSLRAWLRVVPDGLPRTDGIEIGGAALTFTLALAALVAMATGLVPAVSSARANLMAHLRDGRAASPASRRGSRTLVVAQVAVAVIVVAAAALLSRSLLKLQAVGDTLATDRLVLVSLSPQPESAAGARPLQFMTELVERLEAAPGVTAATPVNATPFSGLGWDAPTYTAEGQTVARANANPSLNVEEIYPNYFRTLEVALVRGRPFTPDDREGRPLVAIVSEDVAARTWPGEDPLGKRLKMGDFSSKDPWRTVVGVVTRTRYRELREERASIYVPAAQFQGFARDVVVRSALAPAVVGELVRARVREIDGAVQVQRVRPFAQLLEVPLSQPRFNTLVIAVFASAASVLLGVGLYGVIAASVRQRRPEIGVRMALGATTGDVHRLVLGEGLRLTAAGAVLGLAAAIPLTRVLRRHLYEIEPLDPLALGAAALVLTGVAALSLYLPVRSAGRVDPATTLRG